MIYIRIELWPKGNRMKTRILGEATICNTGGTKTKGDYKAVFSKIGGFRAFSDDPGRMDAEVKRVYYPSVNSIWKESGVKGFPRQILGAWDLLYLALETIINPKEGDKNDL
jgi:hypothetical protein